MLFFLESWVCFLSMWPQKNYVITIATTFRLLIHSTYLYHIISSRKYYKHPVPSTLGVQQCTWTICDTAPSIECCVFGFWKGGCVFQEREHKQLLIVSFSTAYVASVTAPHTQQHHILHKAWAQNFCSCVLCETQCSHVRNAITDTMHAALKLANMSYHIYYI